MLILGIETSCDDTACAIVENGHNVLSNVIITASPSGIPEQMARHHEHNLTIALSQALLEAKIKLQNIHKIAVTIGPGLIPALQTGILFAKGLSISLNIPIAFVNHLEAHIYSTIMNYDGIIKFPLLGSILSGSHSDILIINNWDNIHHIGYTMDDAIGEMFDKVAYMISSSIYNGAIIEELAQRGSPTIPLQKYLYTNSHHPYMMSFSGIKTHIKNLLSKTSLNIHDLAASLQHCVSYYIAKKLTQAIEEFNIKTVLCGGGVTNNKTIKHILSQEVYTMGGCILFPCTKLTKDNAAMIAGLGYYTKTTYDFENTVAQPNLQWGSHKPEH